MNSRFVLVIACIAYAAILNWSYLRIEGVTGYVGMQVRDVSLQYQLVSYLIVATIARFAMPLKLRRPSEVATWVLFLTWLVPALFFTYHVGQLPAEDIFLFILVLTAAFVLLVALSRGRPLVLPRIAVEHTNFALLLAFSTLALTVAVAFLAQETLLDTSVNLFDLTEIYARRLEARQVMDDKVALGYGVATLGACLGPLAVAYGLTTRRLFFTVLGCGGLASIFVFDGSKSALVVPVMVGGFVVLAKRPHLPFGLVLVTGLTAGVVTSIYLYLAQGNVWLSSLFVRREIMAKGTTLGAYFETFRNSPVYMADSSLLQLVGVEPTISKGHLVGEMFGDGIEENWNGSSWAMMYGDFGIIGLFLASVLIALLLRYYDGAAKHVPFPIVAAMAGYGAYVWGEAAVTTSVLTYGVFATLILLSHYGRARQQTAAGFRSVNVGGPRGAT